MNKHIVNGIWSVTRLIEVNDLRETIETVLFSAYVKDEKALSLLIAAKPESGKTKLIKGYIVNEGVCYFTDATAYGIQRDVLPKILSGEVKHLFIADLLTPLSKQTKTRKAFVAFLNNLVEEGIAKISTYMTTWDKEVNCGVIAAVTTDALREGRHEWAKMGFLSRFLTYYYEYTLEQIFKIFDFLSSDEALGTPKYPLEFPDEPQRVKITKEFLDKLNPLAMEIGRKMELYGFRAKVNFRAFLKAHALRDGRLQVEKIDFDRLLALAEHFDISPIFARR